MAIRIKIAETADELNDVFRVRREVYSEEGYFHGDDELTYVLDRFDAHPECFSIIAYDDSGNAVGTLRVNVESGSKLPAEEYYDFSGYRNKVCEGWASADKKSIRFCSAGMLAIKKAWRNRRDVIRALFKMAANIAHSNAVTHVIATINYRSHAMYKRIGFDVLDEKIWIDEINEYVVPLVIEFDQYYQWAMGGLLEEEDLLGLFSTQFEHLVLSDGEYLFRTGETAEECYLISTGSLKITRQDKVKGQELTLALLKKGGLAGELALIDEEPRSANAEAVGSTELMVLKKEKFFEDLAQYPERMRELLRVFSQRIRRMDGLAVVLAYGSNKERLEFALRGFRNSATRDRKRENCFVAKIGPADLARSAGVTEDEAIRFIEEKRKEKVCDFSDHWIRFFY